MNLKPFFVTGTDTDVGKTTISKWLCFHLGLSYYKPIQTGSIEVMDQQSVQLFTQTQVFPSTLVYKAPLSPNQAAFLEKKVCMIDHIKCPDQSNLLIEGAGGVLVPLNDHILMIDLIAQLQVPVLIVARSTLGTLNHTLLTVEALNARKIPVIGIVLNGPKNQLNKDSLEHFSSLKVLDELEFATDEALKKREPSKLLIEALDNL
jgi:dethiobiotin synthetase